MGSFYMYMWEFHAKENNIDEFESVYGPGGLWVRLLRKGDGYIKTDFFR